MSLMQHYGYGLKELGDKIIKIIEILDDYAVWDKDWFISLPENIGTIRVLDFLYDMHHVGTVDRQYSGDIIVDKDALMAGFRALMREPEKLEKWYNKFKLVLSEEPVNDSSK